MSMNLWGLATAAPPQSTEQAVAARIAQAFLPAGREAQLLPALFRRTQVQRRASVVLEPSPDGELRQSFYAPAQGPDDHGPTTAMRMQRYAQEALPLLSAAACRSLERAALDPQQVTHVITVSCTGFHAPGLDVGLIKRLGLQPTVGRLHVGFMGCHGMLNALRAARAIVLAEPDAVVLLGAVELCSLHYQYGVDANTLVANALFADGAGAVVGRAAAGPEGSWRVVSSGSCLLPDSEDGMTWNIGDHGFQMTLSPRVPETIAAYLPPWLDGWLARAGRCRGDIRSWAVHPGGPRILSAVAEALELPGGALDASTEVLAQHGNMSSPTILYVLQQLHQRGARPPCVALGFGPGLVAEAALLE